MFRQTIYLEVLSNCFFNNFVKSSASMFTEFPRVGMVTVGHLGEILYDAVVKVKITLDEWKTSYQLTLIT